MGLQTISSCHDFHLLFSWVTWWLKPEIRSSRRLSGVLEEKDLIRWLSRWIWLIVTKLKFNMQHCVTGKRFKTTWADSCSFTWQKWLTLSMSDLHIEDTYVAHSMVLIYNPVAHSPDVWSRISLKTSGYPPLCEWWGRKPCALSGFRFTECWESIIFPTTAKKS